MKKTITSLLLILSLLFLLTAVSCTDGTGKEPDGTQPPVSAQEAGITSYGYVAEDQLPDDMTLLDWYEQAVAREQLTNALFYAQDAEGLWHCWLYLGAHREGDKLEFAATSQDGAILFRHTAADAEAFGGTGAFYFTVERAAEPTFELYQNDTDAGLLLTLAESAVAK